MGDWGHQAWDSDEAADWFHQFWQGGGMPLVIAELAQFDPRSERYERVRAACQVLVAFGSPYAWPSHCSNADRIQSIERAVVILSHMLNPPNANWCFLEMGVHDATVQHVQAQLQQLIRLRDGVP